MNQNQFDNNFDGFGNIVLNSSASSASQEYMEVSLYQYLYDVTSIENLYDVSIDIPVLNSQQENIINTDTLQDLYDIAVAKNQSLSASLSQAVAAADANSSQSDLTERRDLIIQLRIQLGEGTNASDFSTTYPYEALPLN